jgi:predicted ATPase
LQRSANMEAVAHLTKGLELLSTLPDTPERVQQELAMQTTLGPALVAIKGFAAPEVLRAYARARELCQQAGETPQVFQVLRGLWYFYLMRSELRTALELGEQLLTLAQQVGDPVLGVEAHYALGLTFNYLGKFADAQTHLAQGIALYNPLQHPTHAVRYGQDPGVACRAYGAANLWWLGYPEQALQWSHEALRLARELAHPFSLGFALFLTSWVPQFRREGLLTHERAEAAIALAAEHRFAVFGAGGTIFRGWALAAQSIELGPGQEPREEGIAQLQQGMAAWRATGAEALRPYYLALLAEASGKRGQVEEGLHLLAEALAVANDTGECRWDAELHRLKGELLLARSAELHAEAETCFRQALTIAHGQQAKSYELRGSSQGAQLEVYTLHSPLNAIQKC